MRPETHAGASGLGPRDEPWPESEMACRDVQEVLPLHVDGELEGFRAVLVDRHLAGCAVCRGLRGELERERLWVIEVALDAPTVPVSFASRVVARVRESRRAARIRRSRDAFFRASGVAAAAAIALTAALRIPSGRHQDDARPERPAVLAVDPLAADRALERASTTAGNGEAVDSIARAVAGPEYVAYPEHGAAPEFVVPAARSEDAHMVSYLVFAAYEIGQPGKLPARRFDPAAPCRPDPNRDGTSNFIDVVHSLRKMLPDPRCSCETEEDPSWDPACGENICL